MSTLFFFFSSRRRHTRFSRDWSSDVCSSDLTSSAVPRAWSPPGRPLPTARRRGAGRCLRRAGGATIGVGRSRSLLFLVVRSTGHLRSTALAALTRPWPQRGSKPGAPRSSAEARRMASTASGSIWPPWPPITSAATPATGGAAALVPKLNDQRATVGPTTEIAWPRLVRLGVLGHGEDVFARHLSDQLGLRFANVPLDLADELVVALGLNDLAAFTVDDLRHGSSLRSPPTILMLAQSSGALVLTLAEPWRPESSFAAASSQRSTVNGSSGRWRARKPACSSPISSCIACGRALTTS